MPNLAINTALALVSAAVIVLLATLAVHHVGWAAVGLMAAIWFAVACPAFVLMLTAFSLGAKADGDEGWGR